MTAESSVAKKLIAELEATEFETGSDIRNYTQRIRDLSKAIAVELEYGAQELEAALKDLPPGEGGGVLVGRRKARTVARHLRRAAEAQRAVGVESVRTWKSMVKHYEHLIKPKKRKKALDLTS